MGRLKRNRQAKYCSAPKWIVVTNKKIMSTQRNTGWDLAVYNRDGQLVLVIEIKSKLNAPPEWAAQQE